MWINWGTRARESMKSAIFTFSRVLPLCFEIHQLSSAHGPECAGSSSSTATNFCVAIQMQINCDCGATALQSSHGPDQGGSAAFAQQVRQVETALAYLGEPLAPNDQKAIKALIAKTDEAEAVSGLERILDKYALAIVEINPESRVKVRPGPENTSWSKPERAFSW